MSTSKRIEDMTLQELLNQQAATPTPGGGTEARVRSAIQVRLAEQQDRSAQALVAATEALVSATKQLGRTTARLVCATWGLVGRTLVLVLAEIALSILGRHR